MIRIVLPFHLCTLADCDREIEVAVAAPATTEGVLTALETRFPMLRGTVRDHTTRERRPRVRFFADGRDITHDPTSRPLPARVSSGAEPFIIVGAVSGG